MASLLRQGLRVGKNAFQQQQRRFAGNLPVKPNKFVEEWATRRELIEQEFKWDAKTMTQVVTFGFLVPYAIYTVTVKEYEHADEFAKRSKREMWGGQA